MKIYAKALLLGIALCGVAWAAINPQDDGQFDSTFGAGGFAYGDWRPFGCQPLYFGACKPAIQPDGKIVMVGAGPMAPIDGAQNVGLAVVRFTADGFIDAGFRSHVFRVDFDTPSVGFSGGVALQADGKIVVADTLATQSGNDTQFGIARRNPDGSLDTSFGMGAGRVAVNFVAEGGGLLNLAIGVAVQSDGKILVNGFSLQGHGLTVVRLLADGTLDTSFNGTGKKIFSPGGPDTGAMGGGGIVVDGEGRLLIAATVKSANASDSIGVARLLPNGDVDPSFNSSVTVAVDGAMASGLTLQRDGRLVVVGTADDSKAFAVRLLSDGSLDPSFGDGGAVLFDQRAVSGVTQQADGKLLLAGTRITTIAPDDDEPSGTMVVRLNRNGSLDSTFGTLGEQVFDWNVSQALVPTGIVLQGNQPIVAGLSMSGDSSFAAAIRLTNGDGLFADGFDD